MTRFGTPFIAAAAVLCSAGAALADEVWTSTFGPLTWVDDFETHGGSMALLAYPAGRNYDAGFVSLDNLVGNTNNRGMSIGYWWTHGDSGRDCGVAIWDAAKKRRTSRFGRVVFRFTSKNWQDSDFVGVYGECFDEPTLEWNGRRD